MKWIISVILVIFQLTALADDLKVEIRPSKPVVGEVFQAYFRIFTDSGEDPDINFTPLNVEVVGKSNQGIAVSSVYSNGRLTSTREMTIVYDLVAARTGVSGLRDIVVNLGNKTLRHGAITFNVLKEAEVAADVFVMADVPKKSLFLGEGIVVRYFLYTKVPVSNLDVKKYPKLNGFLKRFLQEPERSERVSVDGQIYTRNQIYAAKLFPEKVGEQKIDPLQLAATVMVGRSNDPFGVFGFDRETRTKTITSEVVKIDVKPLPEEGKPANFTGLVGPHEFDLQVSKPRILVGEPLEIKLTISGGGALENLDAPSIVKSDAFEEFESNGDLKVSDANTATKVFDYTFLAKNPIQLPAANLTLSYFDPESLRYVPVQLQLPEIVVGGVAQEKKKAETPMPKGESSPQSAKPLELPRILSGPVFDEVSGWRRWLPLLNGGLLIVALLIAVLFGLRNRRWPVFTNGSIPVELKRGPFDLTVFTRWLAPLIAETGKSPASIIKEAPLREEVKTYFIDLLATNDYKNFSGRPREVSYVYRADYYRELDRYIKSRGHEDHPAAAGSA